MHEHNECNHNLKYCSVCDVVYCTTCNREWRAYRFWGEPYITYTRDYSYSTGTVIANHIHKE